MGLPFTITIETIDKAAEQIKDVAIHTPLQHSKRLSEKYQANIFLKREDLQEIRSYKIRGAYNLMSTLNSEEKKRGVVCNSAGNHAQGVAYSASHLKINATIFMPALTPLQKVNKVKQFGGKYATVILTGQTFDDAYAAAAKFCEEKKAIFVNAFNHEKTIAGQGTCGKEIYDDLSGKLDAVFVPVGGGGLLAGVSTYMKGKNKNIQVTGIEPKGAAGMYASLQAKKVITLEAIDTFVDGAAIKRIGDIPFELSQKYVDEVIVIPEGQVCTTMIELYQNEGIIAEPAGALSISALNNVKEKIKGKTVVCILSGGNNDINRYPEIIEKSLVFQGLKHYFIIEFAQKPGQLRKFVDQALSDTDDIVRFEYIKKTAKEKGPALVGIEVAKKENWEKLLKRMDAIGLRYIVIKSTDLLYNYLV